MYELRILSGLHRGATLPLDGQAHIIGASEDADVVLVDAGIEQKHATLSLTESGWLVSVLDGSLRSADSNQPQSMIDLMPGDFARLGDVWLTVVEQDSEWASPPPLPTDLEIEVPAFAAAPIEEAQPAAPATAVPPSPASAQSRSSPAIPVRGRRRIAYLPILIAAIFTGAAAYGITYMPSAASVADKPGAQTDLRLKPGATAGSAAPDSAVRALTPFELKKAFEKRLADADLLKRFDLDLRDQAWTMKASLDDEESARFERILTLFVKTHNITFPVQVKVGSAEAMLPFKIREVITGANASLVTQDGDRLYVGDEYRGVRLVAVQSNYLSFAGKRKIDIKW